MKPTCLISGMFNYDTIVSKEGRKGSEQVITHKVGGTGGVVSKLMAALGWKAMPVGHFDDTEEGLLLRDGLAAYGCDTRYVTNLPDGGTTLLSAVLTKLSDGSTHKAIRVSNAQDKAKGVQSRFPRWKYLKIQDARACGRARAAAGRVLLRHDRPRASRGVPCPAVKGDAHLLRAV